MVTSAMMSFSDQCCAASNDAHAQLNSGPTPKICPPAQSTSANAKNARVIGMSASITLPTPNHVRATLVPLIDF